MSDDGHRKLKVTSSLHVAAHDMLVCGRNDGSILILEAVEAATNLLFKPDANKRIR